MRILSIVAVLATLIACTDETPQEPIVQIVPQAEEHLHDDHNHEHQHGTYDDLIHHGQESIEAADYETAILHFMDAVDLDSSRVDGYYGIAFCFSEMRNYTKAEEYFATCMFFDPDYRQTRLNYGSAQLFSGKFDEAVANLTNAIEHDSLCKECYLNRANAYMEIGKNDLMCADLKQAESLGLQDAAPLLAQYCQ